MNSSEIRHSDIYLKQNLIYSKDRSHITIKLSGVSSIYIGSNGLDQQMQSIKFTSI